MDPIDRDAIHEFRLRRMLALEQDHADRKKRLQPIEDRFPVGSNRLITVHEVGEFQIVVVKRRGEESTYFHVFYNLKDTHNSASTFDLALIIALAAKYDNADDAPRYVARLLKMTTEWS